MRNLSFLVVLFASLCFAQSPHGKSFKLDCSNCHTNDNWKVNKNSMLFNHASTGFALTGQHKLNDCRDCHKSLAFSTASKECISCHKDIHKNSVSVECSKCHSTDNWVVKNINLLHQGSRFPLLGQHAAADCNRCHAAYSSLDFQPLGINCVDCHLKNYMEAKMPNHAASGFSKECQSCHSVSSSAWSSGTIGSHDFFPLTDGHKRDNCFDCHKNANFKGLNKECLTCHQKDYSASNHSLQKLSSNCESCHNRKAWTPTSFNHDINTTYKLVGLHTAAKCNQCHTSTSQASTICVDCHQSNFNSSVNPSHTAVGMSKDCVKCHSTLGWVPSSFSHATTGFQLTGAHIKVDCAKCHIGETIGTNQACQSCHELNYFNSKNPNHIAVGLSKDCSKCHTNVTWTASTFSHVATNFQLSGAHVNTDCVKCHVGKTLGTSQVCQACHIDKYNSSSLPNHLAIGLSTDCAKCHNPSAWTPSSFSHVTTSFQLTGAHTNLDCAKCHNGKTTGTSTDCYACHRVDYESAKGHLTNGYPHNCLQCHNVNTFTGVTVDHSKFPLLGAHSSVSCNDCHINGNTVNTPNTCIGCHQAKYNATTNPNHAGLSISTDCSSCHGFDAGWKPAKFTLHTNFFQLTGVHTATDCAKCHNGKYSPAISTTCASCHTNDFNNSKNPNHASVGLSNDCVKCHDSKAWIPSLFSHSTTKFTLTGKHASTAACADCHKGITTGTSTVCYNCHSANFTTAKDHVAQGYPQLCGQCHSTSDWTGVTINHSKFPLSGVHAVTKCSDCHTSGFTSTPTACVSCHQAKYTATTKPNHSALSISTICSTCHEFSAGWKPALFPQHSTYFAFTGAHTAISSNCVKCHITNYAKIPGTCVSCHQAKYTAAVNPVHTATYFVTDCTKCHNTTAWAPAPLFSHTSFYNLASRHSTTKCNQCHTTTTYTTPQCMTCHSSDFSKGHSSTHRKDCWSCHKLTTWNNGPGVPEKRHNEL